MIKQVCITDIRGPRFYTHAEFPLAIGAHPSADIHISNEESSGTAAFLVLIVNRAYIEAENKNISIQINGDDITGPVQLQHDDILQIADTTFHCEHIGDIFSLSLYDDQSHLVVAENEIAEDGEVIEPTAIPTTAILPPKSKTKRILSLASLFIFSLLALVLAYIFTSKTLLISVEPSADTISLKGKIWPIKIKGRYLLQPGKYQFQAHKAGYISLSEEIKVTKSQTQRIVFTLKKKPGYLNISSVPSNKVEIIIDNKPYGETPIKDLKLTAGAYSLHARAENYLPYFTEIVIEGKDQKQNLNIELIPNWAEVTIKSKPANAEVWINGAKKGVTPLVLDLTAGDYALELQHDDYIAYTSDFSVKANEPLKLPLAELFTNPSHVVITSTPPKAIVSISGLEKGITPLTIELNPNMQHTLNLTKAGFKNSQHTISLKPGENQTLNTKLEPILGTLILNVEPQEAELFINGKFVGQGNVKLSLPSAMQRLEVRKSGYEVYEKMLTPDPNTPQSLDIVLNRITNTANVSSANSIRSSQGHELKLFSAGKFTMGTSRREQGRRSNEALHDVELKRQFYLSTTEVTNAQFAAFMATHDSGSYKGHDLSAANLPVVNITWEDAARYCNWLSEKDGLEKAYHENNGTLKLRQPVTTGYRLPTESEWEWVARIDKNGKTKRYNWGNTFPPIKVSGNYADQSASELLDNVIPNYNDGYVTAAPIGSFRSNHNGIFDQGGNVAEWCNDYHTSYASLSNELLIDPTGPTDGTKHVIRGASWLRGDLSNTRLSYRHQSNKKHVDVGFRIARFLR